MEEPLIRNVPTITGYSDFRGSGNGTETPPALPDGTSGDSGAPGKTATDDYWTSVDFRHIGTAIFHGTQTEATRLVKQQCINAAVRENNTQTLRAYAKINEGLMTAANRARLWPVLLGMDVSQKSEERSEICGADRDGDRNGNGNGEDGVSCATACATLASSVSYATPASSVSDATSLTPASSTNSNCATLKTTTPPNLPPHPDEPQVQLDVNRAFFNYPKHLPAPELHQLRQELQQLLATVLRRNPSLCYSQGIHDVAQVFLLVFGSPEKAAPSLEFCLLHYLRDFMLPVLEPALAHTALVIPLVGRVDPELAAVLQPVSVSFGLPWILTVFAHELNSFEHICRVFDFVFATRSMIAPIYLFAALILQRRTEILKAEGSDELLHLLSHLQPDPLSDALLDDLLARAAYLLSTVPVTLLPEWRSVSALSVLKTTAAPSVYCVDPLVVLTADVALPTCYYDVGPCGVDAGQAGPAWEAAWDAALESLARDGAQPVKANVALRCKVNAVAGVAQSAAEYLQQQIAEVEAQQAAEKLEREQKQKQKLKQKQAQQKLAKPNRVAHRWPARLSARLPFRLPCSVLLFSAGFGLLGVVLGLLLAKQDSSGILLPLRRLLAGRLEPFSRGLGNGFGNGFGGWCRAVLGS